MNKRLVLAAASVALVATSAGAQTAGGPPIAYVKIGGTAHEIFLVNPDGSSLMKLYTSPRKTAIGWVDLKPGGGEIAFTEYGNGLPRVIKILPFSAAGPSGPARTLTAPCAPDTVDYHPADPLLIISDICNQSPRIATNRTDGSGYSVLVEGGAYLNKARWLRDGLSYIYVRAPIDGGALQICRNSCNPDNNELLRTVTGLWWMDVGRLSNAVLFGDSGPYTSVLDADTGELIQSNFITGTDGHFSPDDTQVLYETPHSARGDYLHIRNANGTHTRLTVKGEYGGKDWRN